MSTLTGPRHAHHMCRLYGRHSDHCASSFACQSLKDVNRLHLMNELMHVSLWTVFQFKTTCHLDVEGNFKLMVIIWSMPRFEPISRSWNYYVMHRWRRPRPLGHPCSVKSIVYEREYGRHTEENKRVESVVCSRWSMCAIKYDHVIKVRSKLIDNTSQCKRNNVLLHADCDRFHQARF